MMVQAGCSQKNYIPVQDGYRQKVTYLWIPNRLSLISNRQQNLIDRINRGTLVSLFVDLDCNYLLTSILTVVVRILPGIFVQVIDYRFTKHLY